MLAPVLDRIVRAPHYRYEPLTLSGNEITDAVRRAGVYGDGLSPSDFSLGVWAAATNLCTNGGFETNTTGWTTGGTNTIAASAEQFKFGAKSLKAVYADNANLADYAAIITNAEHTVSVWVYIPTAYDGAGIELRQLNYTVATSAVAANMALRDQWQRLTLSFTPGADVTGNIQVNNTGAAPTATRFIYVDGVQVETGSTATPYVETDGATAIRPAGRIQVPNIRQYLNETQGWGAMRIRAGHASADIGSGNRRIFNWADDGDNTVFVYYAEATDQFIITRYDGGVGGPAAVAKGYTRGEEITIVFSWTATQTRMSINGDVFTPAANTFIPALVVTSVDIGQADAGAYWGGDFLAFAIGRGRLTDSDAYAINYQLTNRRGVLKPHELPGDCRAYWNGRDGTFLAR